MVRTLATTEALPKFEAKTLPMAVSIILPVIDETNSLRQTVAVLLEENVDDILEILCIVCRKTTPQALEVCKELESELPAVVRVLEQKKPFLGGAMQDAFDWAKGTHILLMASDLETDPHAVNRLISESRRGWDVVTATRWIAGGGFEGYNPVKFILNWVFQKTIGVLYGVNFSDLTFGFRIFRTAVLRNIRWEEMRHPFLLESILKPIRLGASVKEIPAQWHARVEGESHNSFWRNFLYFRIAAKVRFTSRRAIQGL